MRRYFFSTLLCLTCMACLAQPKVVAHRGYWMTEGSAQNSIASLQKAAEIGCWGSEFDVWMTADGIPVVFHDATVEGIRIEDTTYATLMNHRLQNGEFIPTLQQYLTEAKRLTNCRLIFATRLGTTPTSTSTRTCRTHPRVCIASPCKVSTATAAPPSRLT